MKRFLTTISLIICFTLSFNAQVLDKIGKVKDKIASVTVDKLSKAPITTSFSDVDKTRHMEDSFGNEETYRRIFDQTFDSEKGYHLEPGFYEGTLQSFCIKVGTVMPGRGSGRFYAPLKGPKADILETIIHAYEEDPNLTQREVQVLLWAIIAKVDFQKMDGPAKITALKILSKSQIARLSKGSLDAYSRKHVMRLANKSETTRAILLAENNIRRKYYQGYGSYAEIEEIAMLAGVEPVISGFEPGRWTRHPDGFFIRYYTGGYQKTKTQIYVPENRGAVGFMPANTVAVPAGSGQRLLQTSLPTIDGGPNIGGRPVEGSGTGGGNDDESSTNPVVIKPAEDPFCIPVIDPRADEAIKTQMIMQNIPGVVVAVFTNGRMAHLKAYGYEDVYEKKRLTLSTKVNWASISKSVTGVAAAQLDQRSANYNINDRVTKYLDYWKNVRYMDTAGKKGGRDGRPELIEIKHLLTNSSGVQQYRKGMAGTNYTVLNGKTIEFIENKDNYDSPLGVFDAEKAVSVFNESVLDFWPGRGYLYSSYGFVLAGATVDEASPNGYVDWVKQNIANKADLRTFQVRDRTRPGHRMSIDGILTTGGSGNAEYTLPAGGWESNICDLAKYTRGLSTGIFLDKNKDLLWNNSISVMTPRGFNYSYGLYNDGSGSEFRVWHGGHGGNSRSFMLFFPSDHTGIAILAPTVYSDLPELARHVFQAMGIRSNRYKNNVQTPLDLCGRNKRSGDDRFYGVWRKTSDDVVIRTGLKGATFFEEADRLKLAGYHCVDLEPFVEERSLYWDGVFKKVSSGHRMLNDLSENDFRHSYAGLIRIGFMLIDLEIYRNEKNQRRWAGVFRRNAGDEKMETDMDIDNLELTNLRHGRNNLKLIDIEISPDGSKVHGVWVAGDASRTKVGMTQPDFRRIVREQRDQGFRVRDLEFYWVNDQFRIAAVWERSTDDELVSGDGGGAQMFCDHMSRHESNSSMGYELLDWDRVARD